MGLDALQQWCTRYKPLTWLPRLQVADEREEYDGGLHLPDWENHQYIAPSADAAKERARRSRFGRGHVSG